MRAAIKRPGASCSRRQLTTTTTMATSIKTLARLAAAKIDRFPKRNGSRRFQSCKDYSETIAISFEAMNRGGRRSSKRNFIKRKRRNRVSRSEPVDYSLLRELNAEIAAETTRSMLFTGDRWENESLIVIKRRVRKTRVDKRTVRLERRSNVILEVSRNRGTQPVYHKLDACPPR